MPALRTHLPRFVGACPFTPEGGQWGRRESDLPPVLCLSPGIPTAVPEPDIPITASPDPALALRPPEEERTPLDPEGGQGEPLSVPPDLALRTTLGVAAGELGNTNARKRGAPLGNTNALKHGFYARAFRPAEQAELADLDPASLENEIQLLRVFILRTAQMGKKAANLPESLMLLNVLSHAVISLAALMRTHRAALAAHAHNEFQLLVDQTKTEYRHASDLMDRLKRQLAQLETACDAALDPDTRAPAARPAALGIHGQHRDQDDGGEDDEGEDEDEYEDDDEDEDEEKGLPYPLRLLRLPRYRRL